MWVNSLSLSLITIIFVVLTSASLSNPLKCPSALSMWFFTANRLLPSMMKATCLGMGPLFSIFWHTLCTQLRPVFFCGNQDIAKLHNLSYKKQMMIRKTYNMARNEIYKKNNSIFTVAYISKWPYFYWRLALYTVQDAKNWSPKANTLFAYCPRHILGRIMLTDIQQVTFYSLVFMQLESISQTQLTSK